MLTRTPGLCIEFLNKTGWGKPVFDRINERGYQVDYCFDISECWEKSTDEVGQCMDMAVKKSFEMVLKGEKPRSVSGKFRTPDKIRAMRRLPLFLQQQVMNGIKIESGRVEIVEASDSSKPNGWCGIYFEVVSAQIHNNEQAKEMRERGWLGTYFDGRTIKTDNGEKEATGNWMVLEYKGNSYIISDVVDLNVRKMTERISLIINQA